MQGRGTTHRGNRLLRATAWLQHPPRPAIRQEAGRSSQAVHPFRETSICGNACCSFACAVLTPCCCSPLSPAVGRLRKLYPSTMVLTKASGIIPSRARPYTTPHQGPTCLKTISASRLPHLPPPGQPSLATNVPRLLDDGAVNGLLATAAPLHRPSP